ncbi:MAG TPA: hypothetical protein VNY33_00755, partial [Gaiellaceae bacterium]|nr:hypothetical protein [Gaiellaceae bacterium]
MRRLAPLLCFVVVLAAAGCGGGGGAKSTGGPPNSVIGVSKAFSDAGIPFTSEVTSNPYVTTQQVYLPGKLNGSALQNHVLAFLSGSHISTHAGWVAWVFDSNASCATALKQLPLTGWGAGQIKLTRVTKSNV